MSDINKQVFCIHCGKPIDEGDGFCKYCGKEQDMIKEKPKRKWVKVLKIVLFSILGIGVLIGGILYLYEGVYLPYKRSQEIELKNQEEIQIAVIRKELETGNDSIQTKYAWYIIKEDFNWQEEGYEFEHVYFSNETLDKALELIERKANLGDAECQRHLGLIYIYGSDKFKFSWGKSKTIKDVDKGIYWIKEAAKQNDYWACYVLGEAYINGWGLLSKNKSKAQYYFQKSAEMGCSEAQYALGCLYINGLRDNIYTHAVRIELKNKEYTGPYNYTYDGYNIYVIHVPLKGEVSKEEIAQAQYWWKKAAAQGHEGAIEALQKVYE